MLGGRPGVGHPRATSSPTGRCSGSSTSSAGRRRPSHRDRRATAPRCERVRFPRDAADHLHRRQQRAGVGRRGRVVLGLRPPDRGGVSDLRPAGGGPRDHPRSRRDDPPGAPDRPDQVHGDGSRWPADHGPRGALARGDQPGRAGRPAARGGHRLGRPHRPVAGVVPRGVQAQPGRRTRSPARGRPPQRRADLRRGGPPSRHAAALAGGSGPLRRRRRLLRRSRLAPSS